MKKGAEEGGGSFGSPGVLPRNKDRRFRNLYRKMEKKRGLERWPKTTRAGKTGSASALPSELLRGTRGYLQNVKYLQGGGFRERI